MGCQPESALVHELSDEDRLDTVPAPIREINIVPRSRRNAWCNKLIEFDSEAEAKIYVADDWGFF